MKILSYLCLLVTLRQNTLGPISAKENTATLKWTHQNGLPVARAPSHASKTQAPLYVMTNNNHLTRILCKYVHLWIPYHIPQMNRAKYYTDALPHICCVSHDSFKKGNTHTYITRSSLSLPTLSRFKVAEDFNNIKHCNDLCTDLLRISLNI